MLHIKLSPGTLPLGGMQLDSILSVMGNTWHRTTDYRAEMTPAELVDAFNMHRVAYQKAVDVAFDAAIQQLRESLEGVENRPAASVSAENSTLPEPQPTAGAAGVGPMEVGS